jgi:hypothetical protein
MDSSNDYQMLFLIKLQNGNYSYVVTDEQRNISPNNDDDEVQYYVNDFDDFYNVVPDKEVFSDISTFVRYFT